MLRIKTQDNSHRITLKLEGDLCGVWVCEFLSAWRDARRVLDGRDLLVDLSEVVRVDRAGEYLLALIRAHGSQLSGSGLVIGDLLERIAGDWPDAELNTNQQVPKGR
jgi:ABC-type transporter Mla MlaB component